MKRSEWGLFTGASFLLAVAFPPYFLELIGITFLGGIGLLWRSLRASEKVRLTEFEKKFRQGYRKERAGDKARALSIYKKLIQEFEDSPLITQIAKKQIEVMTKGPRLNNPQRKPSPSSAKKRKAPLKSPKKRRSSRS